jgi:hypothetical protein
MLIRGLESKEPSRCEREPLVLYQGELRDSYNEYRARWLDLPRRPYLQVSSNLPA